jgi:excisionase family DNA binding protein
MPSPPDMTVPAVARLLGCSPPTVRRLISEGHLPATASQRKSRTFLTVTEVDAQAYLQEHGQYQQRPLRGIWDQQALEHLQREVQELQRVRPSRAPFPVNEDQSEVSALREALRLQRAAMASLQDADDARARGTALLLEAMQAFEDADQKRRDVAVTLDAIVGALTTPGDPSVLVDVPRSNVPRSDE